MSPRTTKQWIAEFMDVNEFSANSESCHPPDMRFSFEINIGGIMSRLVLSFWIGEQSVRIFLLERFQANAEEMRKSFAVPF